MINAPRRTPVKLLMLAAMTFVAAMALAACGSGGLGEESNNGEVTTATGGSVEAGSKLTIADWPLFIDPKTIADFRQETGIDTTYNEEINDTNEFFGKLQPLLRNGNSGGRDIINLPDWMSKKMYDLGYIQNLDKDKLKTVDENMIESLKSPAFDPERAYSVPWQSGMSGIVVRKDLAPDIKSVNDMFDPKYKGKVTMLAELRDTVPLVMTADGVDPDEATTEDWMAAIDKLQENVDNGQIRRFTGNDFVQDLVKGDVVAALGWSGDTVQVQTDNPNIEYVQPTEGCSIWSDNLMIPVGAENPEAAYKYMNYVYEPENQAQIAKWVNYVSPVKGVKEILQKEDPEIANNELIFPSEEFTANCFAEISPPGGEAQSKEVEQAFQDLITG
ncbi:MAG: spermidine/putrescine ABC transporter substrate-binding protein [Solirubrobacterales bacterium]